MIPLGFLGILILSAKVTLASIGSGQTLVHLFEWPWRDVALECENFLAPKGFAAVQVSPPQEHNLWNGRPWFERYQPVTYQLDSNSGTRTEFELMVRRCEKVGVRVVVDAVINHIAPVSMGNEHGYGSAGTQFFDYYVPGWFDYDDFHYCRGRHKNNQIRDFESRFELQNCELLSLRDLKTESSKVRTRIATYLAQLMALGVRGFRFDAAKHIPADDLMAILRQTFRISRLKRTHELPFVFSEIHDFGKSVVSAPEYFNAGRTTEFRYPFQLAEIFFRGKIASLQDFGSSFYPSEKTVVFVDNHDTQRNEATTQKAITHKTPNLYRLANIFMLAWPHGMPGVMSSYAFSTYEQGPPSIRPGVTKPVYDANGKSTCGTEWVCEHRWPEIAEMVRFRLMTSPQSSVTDWWSDGENQIAFGRGSVGFVVINRSNKNLDREFRTSLPGGVYCNILGPRTSGGLCLQKLRVSPDGTLHARLRPLTALAVMREVNRSLKRSLHRSK